eukprot:1980366-Karenia_brevis.AAC.1
MLGNDESLRHLFVRVWQAVDSRAKWRQGPIYKCTLVIARMGWSWVEPFCFKTSVGKSLPFLEMSSGEWQHELRE